jgi:hypothetical protein
MMNMLFCQFASMPVESTECVFQINPCVILIRSACHFPITVSESLRIFCHIEVNLPDACGPYGIAQFLNMCVRAYARVCVCVSQTKQSVGLPDIEQSVRVTVLQPVSQPECPVLLRAMCSL